MTAVSSGKVNMDAWKSVLERLIFDDVKIMEFQHVFADIEPENVPEAAAQGFQQANPSCLIASRAAIYLDFLRQCDAPLYHHERRERGVSLTTKPQTESWNFVHDMFDVISSKSTSGFNLWST